MLRVPANVRFGTLAVIEVADTKVESITTPSTVTLVCGVKVVPVNVVAITPVPAVVVVGEIDASAGAVSGDIDEG